MLVQHLWVSWVDLKRTRQVLDTLRVVFHVIVAAGSILEELDISGLC